MFDRVVDYPTAVASYDDAGVDEAIEWCLKHMRDGDTLSVWTSLKSNLRNCSELNSFVQRYSDVQHITGRGGGSVRTDGPVLMAWAGMDDIGKLVQHGSRHIRALCVITWNEDWIRPWVKEMHPAVLGDGSAWENDLADHLDPVVVEALKSMTVSINHNNTISAGFEKDVVVSALLALRGARVPMDSGAMQGWALAHGWSGKNPERLAKYVDDINAGKRPKATYRHDQAYVDRLRARAAGDEEV